MLPLSDVTAAEGWLAVKPESDLATEYLEASEVEAAAGAAAEGAAGAALVGAARDGGTEVDWGA